MTQRSDPALLVRLVTLLEEHATGIWGHAISEDYQSRGQEGE
jgi:hypothetical protein